MTSLRMNLLLNVFEVEGDIKIYFFSIFLNTCLFNILQVWDLLKEMIMCSYP